MTATPPRTSLVLVSTPNVPRNWGRHQPVDTTVVEGPARPALVTCTCGHPVLDHVLADAGCYCRFSATDACDCQRFKAGA